MTLKDRILKFLTTREVVQSNWYQKQLARNLLIGTLISLINVKSHLLLLKKKSTLHCVRRSSWIITTLVTLLDIASSSNCKKKWQNTVIYGKCFGQIQFRQEILWENWSDLWCMARENLSHFFIGFFKRRKEVLSSL